MTAFAAALNAVLSDGPYSALDLAVVAGVSDRLIGYVRTGEKSMPSAAAERICRWLSRRGETRCSLAFLDRRYTLRETPAATVDGSIDAELLDIAESIGDARRAFRDRDRERMRAAVAAARKALDDLDAECAQL